VKVGTIIDNKETVVDWKAVSADGGGPPARQPRSRAYLLLAAIVVGLVLAVLIVALVLQSTAGTTS
jgi:hypothetical protein